jgi:hypothetical protein
MKNTTFAIIGLLFAVVRTGIANESGDPVFKALGEAIEEAVASVVEVTIADNQPAAFSIGVVDSSAVPLGDLTPLPLSIRSRLSKRISKLWANYVELDQVKFITRGKPTKDRPQLILPKVPHDSTGHPISFLTITGLHYVDDQTVQVSWKCTGGSPSGVGGTEVVRKVGNEWKISRSTVYNFD